MAWLQAGSSRNVLVDRWTTRDMASVEQLSQLFVGRLCRTIVSIVCGPLCRTIVPIVCGPLCRTIVPIVYGAVEQLSQLF
jgi:hypothetical protein